MMKNLLLFLIYFKSIFLIAQIQPINLGEKSGWISYYETLGEFSPKNNIYNSGFNSISNIKWKSGNSIFVYGSDQANFWEFNRDLHQWRCIAPPTNQLNRGEKGVYSSTNYPGTRYSGSIYWIDLSGNLYLYSGNIDYNDLWKFDLSLQQWAWIGGYSDETGSSGNQGPIGVESTDYFPNLRTNAMAIPDENGYVYIYGGDGINGSINGYHLRTDLWRYNTQNNAWTLLYENPLDANNYQYKQNIVEIGVEHEMNHPGYLSNYTGWYSDGYLWYFGGRHNLNYSSTIEDSYNQVWRYNLNNGLWTCMKNPSSKNAVFGIQGESSNENTPSALKSMSNAVVLNNEAYFFGGIDSGEDEPNEGLHNSLWKYNMATNQWIWVKGNSKSHNPGFYGRKGEEYEYNIPSSRQHSIMWIENGNIILFGGVQTTNKLFDIWKYNPVSNNFSWIDGKSYRSYYFSNYAINAYHLIEDEEVPSVFNHLNLTSVVWQQNKGQKLYSLHKEFSGTFANPIRKSGLWEFDTQTSKRYLLVRDEYEGDGNYGQLGIANASNFPPYRNEGPSLWETSDKLYIMHGYLQGQNRMFNDFWVFDKTTKLWTWIGGNTSQETEYYHYGEIGVASPENYPRNRYNASTWVDEEGNLWLFGGRTQNNGDGLNDFWKFDVSTGLWILMGGSENCNDNFISDQYPSCIHSQSAWRKGDDLYFYGGFGVGYDGFDILTTGNLTDVWKYSIQNNTWKLVSGNRKLNNAANFGEFQYPLETNQINTKDHYVFWDDDLGNLWVYGGNENVGDFALWKFDTNLENWVWMDGSNTATYYNFDLFNFYNYNFFGELKTFSSYTYRGLDNVRYFNNDGILWEIDINQYPNHYNKIEGHVFFDNEGNCTSDSYKISNFKLKVNNIDNIFIYSNQEGYYKVFTPELTNTISGIGFEDNYFTINPESQQINFDSFNNSETIDFCLTPQGQHNDLEIFIIPLQDPRPGFDSEYKIIYRNKGNTSLSGTIKFLYDNSIFTYLISNPEFDSEIPGELSWNYSDLNPFEEREIYVSLNLSTTAPIGGTINLTAIINPIEGDEIELDNTFILTQTIVSSYDPNDKTCLEGESVYLEQVGEFVHYLIRFENTGTADAINIVIKDEIDPTKFDIATLTPINSSHNFYTKIENNTVEFIFEDIHLPFEDELNDGYVLFKIKLLNSLEVGDQFSNSANIFFDYNEPITTNTYITTIEEILSLLDIPNQTSIQVYPNPTNGEININSIDEILKIELFDMNGRILFRYENINEFKNISSLSKGIYFIKIYSKNGISTHKIIKQ